jgi:class 3 adenylate cyclase
MFTSLEEIKKNAPVDPSASLNAALALQEVENADYTSFEKGEIYHLVGLSYHYLQQSENALIWYYKALPLRELADDQKGLSDTYNNIGNIYSVRGDYAKAMDFLSKAQVLREELKQQNGIATLHMNIGTLLFHMGNDKEAISRQYQALDIFTELEDKLRISMCQQNIALVYQRQGHYLMALELYVDSMRVAEELGNKQRIIELKNNIGTVLLKLDKLEEATTYFQDCLSICETESNKKGILTSLINLAVIDQKTGDYKKAIEKMKLGISMVNDSEDPIDMMKMMNSIGTSYTALGQYVEAEYFLTESLKRAEKNQNKDQLDEIYIDLSALYEAKGDYHQALDYYRKYSELKLEINSTETNTVIHELRTRYEVEAKQKEAEIHKLKNIELKEALDDLTLAKAKSDELLLNILPADIAEEIKSKGKVQAQHYDLAAVLFMDVRNFTLHSQSLSPEELVSQIDTYFSLIDSLLSGFKVEKIKTIGDAYLCAAGVPIPDAGCTESLVRAAIHIRDEIAKWNKIRQNNHEFTFEFRFGIHAGPLVAGVVGKKKFEYDIWGDTVNTAARMEQHGEPGKINISGEVYELIKDKFECSYRGKIEAKNKGLIDMYFVERLKANNI